MYWIIMGLALIVITQIICSTVLTAIEADRAERKARSMR